MAGREKAKEEAKEEVRSEALGRGRVARARRTFWGTRWSLDFLLGVMGAVGDFVRESDEIRFHFPRIPPAPPVEDGTQHARTAAGRPIQEITAPAGLGLEWPGAGNLASPAVHTC